MDKMKFNIDDVSKYQGEDLILMIGCPGSRWSNVHRWISEHPMVNNTDWSDEKSWAAKTLNVFGEEVPIGNHRGSYWGPYNYYGHGFDKLELMSKEEILTEFMEAYETWDKVKIIKSHWFAYNIPYLHSLFPKAKIVSCYVGDLESFYWWHKCGGWGLGYAGYSWYNDDMYMYEMIKQENENILKFHIDRDSDFKKRTRAELWEMLGFTKYELDGREDKILRCKIAVYSGDFIDNFNHFI